LRLVWIPVESDRRDPHVSSPCGPKERDKVWHFEIEPRAAESRCSTDFARGGWMLVGARLTPRDILQLASLKAALLSRPFAHGTVHQEDILKNLE